MDLADSVGIALRILGSQHRNTDRDPDRAFRVYSPEKVRSFSGFRSCQRTFYSFPFPRRIPLGFLKNPRDFRLLGTGVDLTGRGMFVSHLNLAVPAKTGRSGAIHSSELEINSGVSISFRDDIPHSFQLNYGFCHVIVR